MQEIGNFKVLGAFIDGILSRDEYQGRGIPHKHFLVPIIDKTGLDQDEMVQMIMDLIRTIRIEIEIKIAAVKASHVVIHKEAVKDVLTLLSNQKSLSTSLSKQPKLSQQPLKGILLEFLNGL